MNVLNLSSLTYNLSPGYYWSPTFDLGQKKKSSQGTLYF